MARGTLRIYLGAAPGVGKTFAMLNEGMRRASRGTDVVVGFVETHGRPNTAGADRRSRDRPPSHCHLPRGAVRGDGRRRRHRPQAGGGPGRRARAHQRARFAQREALAGRRGAPRLGRRRDLDRERAAPRVDERRRRADHRHQAAGDHPGLRGAGGGSDRDRRHDAAGAAAPDGARQHLSGREGRRLAGQLLPRGQPRRAARARADVGRRPGRRGVGDLPRGPRDRAAVGDAGAGRRRDHGRTRR